MDWNQVVKNVCEMVVYVALAAAMAFGCHSCIELGKERLRHEQKAASQ